MDNADRVTTTAGSASGSVVDWGAAARIACATTTRGALMDDAATVDAYRYATIEAREAVSSAIGTEVDLPETIEVLDRHHWIERSADTFELMLSPATTHVGGPAIARAINTASATAMLAVLARRVVGQYDPALFGEDGDRALYLVDPNVASVADDLDLAVAPFRRWIIHHEVVHVAEFELAPWLGPYLETRLTRVLDSLTSGRLDREALDELTRAMTVVEGFAELVMDEAFDADVTAMRRRLDARRGDVGPIGQLVDWLLGLSAKRSQYVAGRAFFATIADTRGLDATLAVWSTPEALPRSAELDDPHAWLDRIDQTATGVD